MSVIFNKAVKEVEKLTQGSALSVIDHLYPNSTIIEESVQVMIPESEGLSNIVPLKGGGLSGIDEKIVYRQENGQVGVHGMGFDVENDVTYE